MEKYIRIFIAIVVVVCLVLLAKSQAAWAANPTDDTDQSSLAQLGPSVSLDKHDPCDKDKGKDKKKCEGGSVLPPDDDIKVCQRGDYSVGGVATLDVKNLRGNGCLMAHTQDSDPSLGQLPAGTSTIVSDVVALTLPAKGGNLKICFAVPPGKQAKIYSSEAGSWTAVKTRVKNGVACAEVKKSGNFGLFSP